MPWNWVPEQQEIRDKVKVFAEKHIVPVGDAYDRLLRGLVRSHRRQA